MADDTTQRAAFAFLREHLQSQEPFTREEFIGEGTRTCRQGAGRSSWPSIATATCSAASLARVSCGSTSKCG